jgi:hypothetical protein
MNCIFCAKPIEDSNLRFCLDCDLLQILRAQVLDDIFFFMQEENELKKRLTFIRKQLKEAEKRYNELWAGIDNSILTNP